MKLIQIIIIALILLAIATPASAQIEPVETGCAPGWICPYRVYVPMVVHGGRVAIGEAVLCEPAEWCE